MDSKTDHNIDKKDVSGLLEKSGFNVVDITEINGLTFFYSQNVRQPIEIKAWFPYMQRVSDFSLFLFLCL